MVPDSARYDVYEIISVYSEIETKPINKLWRSHTELLSLEEGERCCYVSALKWFNFAKITCALKSLIYDAFERAGINISWLTRCKKFLQYEKS
jgi:hypothetical protein